MSPVRVGVMGCGRIALSVHLRILAHLPGVQLTALAEADSVRRAEARSIAPHAAVFSDYREMLEMPQLDAVVISLPNALHEDAAIAAFANDKHVYMEKPLATSLDEGRRILSAWRRSGRIGMIGFNYRLNSLYRSLRVHLQSGRIGRVIAGRSVFGTVRANGEGWRDKRVSGGGVLLDLASHHIDLTRFFFGREISHVSASLRSARGEDDTAVLQMRLSDGSFVQSFFSLSTLEEDCFEVYGESGKLAVDRYRSYEVEYSALTREFDRRAQLASGARFLLSAPLLVQKFRSVGHEPSYRAALSQFVEAARTGRAVSPDLEDGFRSLAVVLAAEQSAATGIQVAIPPDAGPAWIGCQ